MGDKKRKLVQNEAETIQPEGKKAKKEKKDKKSKKEKRKADAEDIAPAETVIAKEEKKDKKEKKEKKDKKEKKEKRKRDEAEDEQAAQTDTMEVSVESTETADAEKKKAKKEKKKQKKESKQQENESAETAAGPQDESAKTNDESTSQKSSRFIVFVGNLPYSANTESVTKHFEKNPPASVRVATKKEDVRKCRGFAFIEFENYDRMKTCLKLYHHSNFDDGKYPPRRINVELTAGGGGGKSDHRRAKIQAKNEKLENERQRDAKEIQKEKKRHDKKAGQAQHPNGTAANAVGADGANDAAAEDDRFAGVHPSRRQRLG